MSKKSMMLGALLCFSVVMGGAAAEPKVESFQIPKDSELCFLQLADIQERGVFRKRLETFTRWVIETEKPAFVVLTGDNIDSGNSRKGSFEKNIAPFIKLLQETEVRLVVTFGNHDSDHTSTNFYTRQELYDTYKKEIGELFIDHDVAELSGVGSGKIALKDGEKTVLELFVMDSGARSTHGGYDGVKKDQIRWYEENSEVPCLWFQHIIVPDVCKTGILLPCSAEEKAERKIAYKINPERTTGEIKENPCPTNEGAYVADAYTYEGRTLYQSWLKKGNMRGAFFGHDHINTFDGVDTNGVRIAMTKGMTLANYNDGNPGIRVFKVKTDGTYRTWNVTESEMKKAQESQKAEEVVK